MANALHLSCTAVTAKRFLEFSDQPPCMGTLPGTNYRCLNGARMASISGDPKGRAWQVKMACFEHSYLLDDDRFTIVVSEDDTAVFYEPEPEAAPPPPAVPQALPPAAAEQASPAAQSHGLRSRRSCGQLEDARHRRYH